MGWSPDQFWRATEMELYFAIEGYNDKVKDDMIVTRYSTYLIMCSMAGSKEVGSINKIWPLEDRKIEVVEFSEDEKKKVIERFKKRVKSRKK